MRDAFRIVSALLALYLLIYVNTPTSVDGKALLATAVSLAERGRADISSIGYTQWFISDSGRMGATGADGALYSKKGITPSLMLVPLVWAAHLAPSLPVRATALLFNPLVTAITAALLYVLARDLHFGRRIAIGTALIYGLATFAPAYTRTLFGEPLAALLLLLALLAARRGSYTAGGALIALLAGINTAYGVFALPMLLLIGPRWRALLPFGAALAAGLALIAAYNLARFGAPLTSGYHFDSGEGFDTPPLLGLYGLFFSPYRGLFWYSPPLLLAIPGLIALWRRARRFTGALLLSIALCAIVFAAWWSWHGGFVWGPRFLLPVLPLMALGLAPILEHSRRLPIALTLAALIALSLPIQFAGALYSFLPYENYLFATYWPDLERGHILMRSSPVLTDPAFSPIVAHLRLLLNGASSDVAWFTGGDLLHALLALALLAAAWIGRPWLILLAAALALNGIAARQLHDPAYDAARVEAVRAASRPGATLIAATTAFDDALLDLERRAPVYTVNAPTADDDLDARALWADATRAARQIDYLTWFAPGQPEDWMGRWLWDHAFFAGEIAVSEHRLLRFNQLDKGDADAGSDQPALQPGGQSFGPVRLVEWGAQAAADGLYVVLRWDAPPAGATWFVHVLDAGGEIIAQQDRAPAGPLDRLFFPVEGAHALRIGWLDTTGAGLPVSAADGEPVAEGFVIYPLR